jgi:hypothetical protein
MAQCGKGDPQSTPRNPRGVPDLPNGQQTQTPEDHGVSIRRAVAASWTQDRQARFVSVEVDLTTPRGP